VKPGDTVAVNGAGFAGNIILQGALKAGASLVIAVDTVRTKLTIARQLGAHATVDPSEGDPVARVLELTGGEGVDVAVDAVGGTGQGIVQALGMVRHAGILALYGDNYAPVKEFCFHRFHEDGLEIRTLNPMHYTHLQAIENMREAFRAVERGVFNLDVILEHSERHPLDDIGEIFRKEAEAGDSQASLKTLILP
jgi:threonine dehydrogenase-like Zn-dependent dehydrogenase